MSSQERESFSIPMSRRSFPLVTAGLVAAVWEIACRPQEDQIFPDTTIDKDFFSSGNIHKLVELAQKFANIQTILPIQRSTSIQIPVDLDFYNKVKIKNFGLYTDEDDYLGINFYFRREDQVYLGEGFHSGSKTKPAFVMGFKKGERMIRLSHAPEIINVGGGNFSTDPLAAVKFRVNLTAKDVDQKDVIIIVNKGLFNHQTQRAFVLPIRFTVSYQEPNQRVI